MILAAILVPLLARILEVIHSMIIIIYNYKSYCQSSGDRLWCLPGADIECDEWFKEDEEEDEEEDDIEYSFKKIK